MSNTTIGSKGYPPIIASLGARGDALTQILCVLITALFWFAVSFLFVILHLMHALPFDLLSTLYQAASFLGLSPVLLTVLSWRGVEKLLYLYINYYVKTHVQMQS